MKKYTGKNLDAILQEIVDVQGVNIDDIEYNILKQSGFSIFSKIELEAFSYVDCIASVKEYILNVLSALELDVNSLEVNYIDKTYQVALDTNQNSLLIGPNGRNLYALEYLTSQMLSTAYKHRFFVKVDCNGYFKEKERRLTSLAYRLAAEVGKTKMDLALDPMPNYDRKVIHKALKEVHYVKTKSVGLGKERHLVIMYDLENDLKYNEMKKKA
ncbi:MAG: protein jag [Bacilli bacterium]